MDPRLLLALLCLAAFSAAAYASDEIHGCGGFVEVRVPLASLSLVSSVFSWIGFVSV
jgi:hypothetical protein